MRSGPRCFSIQPTTPPSCGGPRRQPRVSSPSTLPVFTFSPFTRTSSVPVRSSAVGV
ncbi:hypothetical protein [Archangium sp.]|uniref:hypothetical protein n=1 Tax=Archangium sp. TaxID=1872627 RepID=UPI002E307409|nr:hypothetical protein [Archangium sp.]